jgi:diguanylate cyclase (GGDEF)-like protein
MRKKDTGRDDSAVSSLQAPPGGGGAQVIPLASRLRREMRTQSGEAGYPVPDRRHASAMDRLTGLPGPERFRALVANTVSALPAHADVAMLMMRIDHFADINDFLGDDSGDRLIGQFSDRLRQCLTNEELIGHPAVASGFVAAAARLKGTRFAILLSCANEQDLNQLRSQINSQLQCPFEVDGQSVFLSVTMGAALYPRDATDGDSLVRAAERAMEHALVSGLGYVVGSAEKEGNAQGFLELQVKLHRAFSAGELRVAYQPIVDAVSGRVVAAEALLRWDDPEVGAVSPAQFVPVAEQCGLMVRIGERVTREAIHQLAVWRDEGLRPVRVAVNLSLCQLLDGDFVASVARELGATGVEPALLEFELSERGVMTAHGEVMERIHALKALGVRISIDDFGTGHASIAYLKDVPADVIKIDRSYVSGPDRSKRGDAVCAGIVALARQIDAEIVGEGVETQEQLTRLRNMGCDYLQGFQLSAAVAPSALAAHLR